MLKFLVIAALVALVKADAIDKYTGVWRGIEIFHKNRLHFDQECSPATISKTDVTCECENGEKVWIVDYKLLNETIQVPVYIADTFEKAQSGFDLKCTQCTAKQTWVEGGNLIMRHLNDNYSLLYVTEERTKSTTLVAREIPSEAELEKFVETIDEVKEKNKSVLCTSEIKNSSGAQHHKGSGLKWHQH